MPSKKTKIRTVKELPEWYSLEKYKAATSLDAASWYEILLQRWNHFFWFDRETDKKHITRDRFYYDSLIRLRNDPLHRLTGDIEIVLFGGGQLQALKYDQDDFATFSYAISPLTIRRLYQNERRLKDTARLRARKWFDLIFDDLGKIDLDNHFETESAWARSFIDDPIFEAFEKQGEEKKLYEMGRSHDLVQIDLSVPDKILIQQFTDYLRHVRQKYPDVKKVHEYKYPEYQKWIDYAVLPYLDLKLWADIEGHSIPNRVMADAIFLDGEKGEEMVRKTTKKIADMLMTKEYIDFLATITAHEIAEKKPKKIFRQK